MTVSTALRPWCEAIPRNGPIAAGFVTATSRQIERGAMTDQVSRRCNGV